MNVKKVLLEYKNIFDQSNNIGYVTNLTRTLDVVGDDLEKLISVKENFLEVKDIIFTMTTYPVFIHCAKLYKEYYKAYFYEIDLKLFNNIQKFIISQKIYYNSNNLFEAICDYNLCEICDITHKDSFYNNKIVAMYNYSQESILEIDHLATKYVDIYFNEIDILKSLTSESLIKDFYDLYLDNKTYHFRIRLINELYLYLNSEYKNEIKRIIDIGLNSSNFLISDLREEFEYLDLAFKYKNKGIK